MDSQNDERINNFLFYEFHAGPQLIINDVLRKLDLSLILNSARMQ